jgi:small subunit ribosomal protein S3
MGQKVHPESMRVGYIHDWKSNWFNEKQFADYLAEDVAIRRYITNRLATPGLSDITIRKDANEVEVNINTARPGIVIGKSGSEVDQVRRDLHRITNKQVKVNILEIKRPELDAKLVAQSIAEQLVNRVAFRRAMKRALTSAMRSGAKGCKVQVSGRLGGAEMARTENYSDGASRCTPCARTSTTASTRPARRSGRIGVKCWINKGEIMPEGYTGAELTELDAPQPQRPTTATAAGATAVTAGAAVAVAAARAAAPAARVAAARARAGSAAAAVAVAPVAAAAAVAAPAAVAAGARAAAAVRAASGVGARCSPPSASSTASSTAAAGPGSRAGRPPCSSASTA